MPEPRPEDAVPAVGMRESPDGVEFHLPAIDMTNGARDPDTLVEPTPVVLGVVIG